MGTFLRSAYKVLKMVGCPLSAKEITRKAIEDNFLKTSGKTPAQTMKSKLSTNILRQKNKSLFKRSEAGMFALREWDSINEYSAPRLKKVLFDEEILVFEKDHLSKFIQGDGLLTTGSASECPVDKLKSISFSTKRRDAEKNFDLIQLVSVFLVRYGNKYLTHKRTKRLPEDRLHGFYSIMMGGHLTPDDILPLFNKLDPHRELMEELKLTYLPKIEYRGLLYDSSKEVSKIHLGIVYDVFLKNEEFEIGERGFLMDPKFETIEEIRNRIDDFENWSQILVEGCSFNEF